MQEALDMLKARVIRDVEGMPWQDKGISNEQLLNSVKYFINAYTNDVMSVIGETNDKKTMDRRGEESVRGKDESSPSS